MKKLMAILIPAIAFAEQSDLLYELQKPVNIEKITIPHPQKQERTISPVSPVEVEKNKSNEVTQRITIPHPQKQERTISPVSPVEVEKNKSNEVTQSKESKLKYIGKIGSKEVYKNEETGEIIYK